MELDLKIKVRDLLQIRLLYGLVKNFLKNFVEGVMESYSA